MLRLALCDDEAGYRAASEKLLRDYLEREGSPMGRLSVFCSARELLDAVAEEGCFDIYLLDVVMPGLSGVELGKQLRAMNCGGVIIYLSVSAEYALDSYQAQAFYYLLKPVEPEQLYHILDQAVMSLEKQRAGCITVKTRQDLRRLRLDDILYAELVHRTIHYYLTDGQRVDSVTVRRPFLEEMAPLLVDDRFLSCGASFVVNLHYINAVEKNALHLDGGLQVPLPRGAFPGVQRRWQDYWLGDKGVGKT